MLHVLDEVVQEWAPRLSEERACMRPETFCPRSNFGVEGSTNQCCCSSGWQRHESTSRQGSYSDFSVHMFCVFLQHTRLAWEWRWLHSWRSSSSGLSPGAGEASDSMQAQPLRCYQPSLLAASGGAFGTPCFPAP